MKKETKQLIKDIEEMQDKLRNKIVETVTKDREIMGLSSEMDDAISQLEKVIDYLGDE